MLVFIADISQHTYEIFENILAFYWFQLTFFLYVNILIIFITMRKIDHSTFALNIFIYSVVFLILHSAYIYIYIYRHKEKEKERETSIHEYLHIHIVDVTMFHAHYSTQRESQLKSYIHAYACVDRYIVAYTDILTRTYVHGKVSFNLKLEYSDE